MQLSTAMDIPVCNMLCQPEKCDKLKEYGGHAPFLMIWKSDNDDEKKYTAFVRISVLNKM